MVYIINFLAVAAFPLAIAGYGGHVAAKVLEGIGRRKALTIIWGLAVFGALLSGVQQVLVYRSDQAHDIQQGIFHAQAKAEQQQLRQKLDRSLEHEEEVRNELGSIVRYLQSPRPRMSSTQLAGAASKMVEDAMHR